MTDGNRTFLKWSVLTCFLTKKQFYYRKIFVITCHLNCILWMKDNVRQVVSTFLNAGFKPSLKIGVYAFQHLTINCCHFLPDCLLQIRQDARFVSNLLPLHLQQHTSCMDEILNLSAKLCALIHDLTSFHARVFVQTALDSESALVSPSRCFLASLRSYWDQVASSLQYFLLSSDCESTWESYCGWERCPGVQGWNEREKAAALLWQTHHFAHTHHKQTCGALPSTAP